MVRTFSLIYGYFCHAMNRLYLMGLNRPTLSVVLEHVLGEHEWRSCNVHEAVVSDESKAQKIHGWPLSDSRTLFTNGDLSKLQLGITTTTPPPFAAIKVSPRRLLLGTNCYHPVCATDRVSTPCLETEYNVFPSLYHKYINYANYEHCILTQTHFLSPLRRYIGIRGGQY